ncbi:riboflavin kinase [Aneurinibacillus aneurinilyticus]|uniref:riboflavin kinase n=1 Tax=Aneurinibacillus aneurinilyticus TaxID=1391 RepID=UPI0009DC162D
MTPVDDKYAKVTICFFVREEKKFPFVSSLISQINKDINIVKKRMALLKLRQYHNDPAELYRKFKTRRM